MKPKETINEFDAYLAKLDLRLDAVVIGGAALSLMGIISRQTRDFDILHPILPQNIVDAANKFAAQQREHGEILQDDWLNNGPVSLADVLPSDWMDRIQLVYSGQSVVMKSLGRSDLLRSKLFALCDRGTDLQDCVALAPTTEEVRELIPWLEYQDANPLWPEHVREVITDLQQRLSHGI